MDLDPDVVLKCDYPFVTVLVWKKHALEPFLRNGMFITIVFGRNGLNLLRYI